LSESNQQLLESYHLQRKPFILGDLKILVRENLKKKADFAVLSFSEVFTGVSIDNQIALSPERSLHEAAKNLFAAMRKLDESSAEFILAGLLPEEGLGRAINDRLRRASAK
jgi:L-threonylcarbamoyladenylate synthase